MSLYLADTSAWHRSAHDAIADAWARRLSEDELATCAQVRLEVLFSAKGAEDYDRLASELLSLHQLPCGEAAFDRALEVQRLLARHGALHHRSVKIADLLIAATAEATDVVVWHYDEDFDRIAEVTGQRTSWAAPRGSL